MFKNKTFFLYVVLLIISIIIFEKYFVQIPKIQENETNSTLAKQSEEDKNSSQNQLILNDSIKQVKKTEINEGACIGCHGTDWSKIALNASKNVAKMSEDEIIEALIGYKNGRYGREMKKIMKAQVENYSDEMLIEFASKIKKSTAMLEMQEHNDLAQASKPYKINSNACVICHGTDWSKAALGKSKNVAAMSKADIAAALKGYKAGTYGGPMKDLMTGQVAKYSDADLDAFAQTIGK